MVWQEGVTGYRVLVVIVVESPNETVRTNVDIAEVRSCLEIFFFFIINGSHLRRECHFS